MAVLFGNERSGLSNEELKRCTETVAIPTAAVPSSNPKDPLVQSSLNLSHAVTVLCYEVCAGVPRSGLVEPWKMAAHALLFVDLYRRESKLRTDALICRVAASAD